MIVVRELTHSYLNNWSVEVMHNIFVWPNFIGSLRTIFIYLMTKRSLFLFSIIKRHSFYQEIQTDRQTEREQRVVNYRSIGMLTSKTKQNRAKQSFNHFSDICSVLVDIIDGYLSIHNIYVRLLCRFHVLYASVIGFFSRYHKSGIALKHLRSLEIHHDINYILIGVLL